MTACERHAPPCRGADLIREHLPWGKAWLAFRTPGKFFYRVVEGLGLVFDDIADFFCYLERELDPRTTCDLLPEWQGALGLPDECFPPDASKERQLEFLLFRLNKRRYITIGDFQDLADFFGLDIVITPGAQVVSQMGYALCYPIQYGNGGKVTGYEYGYPVQYGQTGIPKSGRFRVYIDLPTCRAQGYDYEYPLEYQSASSDCEAFLCLIKRLMPANVVCIVNNTPPGCDIEPGDPFQITETPNPDDQDEGYNYNYPAEY